MTATLFFISLCKSQRLPRHRKLKETETVISLDVIFNFVFSAIALTEDLLIKSLGGATGFCSFFSLRFYCILESEKPHLKI